MISNNKKTGRGRMTCSFETELSELLGSKHNIEPLAVCGSKGLIVREVIRTNTPLPMDDINMSNVNPQEVENILIENNSTEATNNNLKQTLKKNERKNLGATARMLESCQKTIEQFATSVQGDSNNKYDVQKEMLEEYKK
ncbi:uncharacterized protein [Temnothorax nylanderi]|uniref:uncharacterized protein n=1 Tax=Temnothorax nylanderi TaxID=102681 RepID=UPI003A8AA1B0